MITVINVWWRCRKAGGGYCKGGIRGKKRVFFSALLLDYPLSCSFSCSGVLFFQQSLCDMYLLFFSTSLQIGVWKLRLEVCLLRLGLNSLDRSLLGSYLKYVFLILLLTVYFLFQWRQKLIGMASFPAIRLLYLILASRSSDTGAP